MPWELGFQKNDSFFFVLLFILKWGFDKWPLIAAETTNCTIRSLCVSIIREMHNSSSHYWILNLSFADHLRRLWWWWYIRFLFFIYFSIKLYIPPFLGYLVFVIIKEDFRIFFILFHFMSCLILFLYIFTFYWPTNTYYQ